MIKQKEILFPKMESIGEIVQMLRTALQRAAEEMYKSDMVDTNMEVLEIAEAAAAYCHYENDEEKQLAITNCTYETKEVWIKDKIEEWLNG